MRKPENPDKKNPVPVQGSLGLLAVGYKGLLAWRLAKLDAEKEGHQDQTNQKSGRSTSADEQRT